MSRQLRTFATTPYEVVVKVRASSWTQSRSFIEKGFEIVTSTLTADSRLDIQTKVTGSTVAILALPPLVAQLMAGFAAIMLALSLPEPFPGGHGISSSCISFGIKHPGRLWAAGSSAFVNPSGV